MTTKPGSLRQSLRSTCFSGSRNGYVYMGKASCGIKRRLQHSCLLAHDESASPRGPDTTSHGYGPTVTVTVAVTVTEIVTVADSMQ